LIGPAAVPSRPLRLLLNLAGTVFADDDELADVIRNALKAAMRGP